MTDTTNALDVDGITARLTELEAEREALLGRLTTAQSEIAAVLSCYPAPAAAPTRRRVRADATDPPIDAPKKRGRPRNVAPVDPPADA